jgi:hypothetical protein
MSPLIRRLQKVPAFPLIPFMPMLIAGGLLALSILTFTRVVRLNRAMEVALNTKAGGASA